MKGGEKVSAALGIQAPPSSKVLGTWLEICPGCGMLPPNRIYYWSPPERRATPRPRDPILVPRLAVTLDSPNRQCRRCGLRFQMEPWVM